MVAVYPDVWISPVEPAYDGPTVDITIGPGITGKSETFSVHLGRLEAVSGVCCKRLDSSKDEYSWSSSLDCHEPSVFRAFYDWLYKKQSFGNNKGGMLDDHFWASVFSMAASWHIPALQLIAFDRFAKCFPAISSKVDTNFLPSDGLITSLFQDTNPNTVLKEWILDHLCWQFKEPSKALSELKGACVLPSTLGGNLMCRYIDRKHEVLEKSNCS